jgi:hypothetical protein
MTEGLMDVGHVIPEAIRELLEKRGTFQAWLNRLDELGSEFRPEVADKVRSDYASRLGEVEAELEGHRAELEAALADRTAAVEKVDAEHDARSAELEETQLRHVVGEFDDAEWERRRSEHQVQIDELEAELTAQRSAVDSLQTVLSELTGQAAAASVSAAIEADAEPLDEAAVAEDTAWMTQPFDDAADDSPEVVEKEATQEAEAAEEATVTVEEEVGADVESAVERDKDLVRPELVDQEVAERDFADAEFVEAEVVDEEEVASESVLDEPDTGDFMDELEFLESLSLDDAASFDAVSAMLDEDEGDSGTDAGSKRETEDL